MVFLSGDYFIYDGWDSKLRNLMLVEIGDNDELLANGIEYDISTKDGINFPLYANSTMQNKNFTITICKIEQKTSRPLPFTEEDIFEINRIFFCQDNELKPLIVNGYTVMCKAINGESWRNSLQQGYINITLFALPYMTMGKVHSGNIIINGSDTQVLYHVDGKKYYGAYKYITLDNKTNAFKEIGLDINFKLSDSAFGVNITNMNTGQTMGLRNLDTEELKNIHIYGDEITFIKSNINNNLNLMKNLDEDNKDWIKLAYGYNKIKIEVLTTKKEGYNYFDLSYTPKICYQ